MVKSFVKLNRGELSNDLLECHPNAFLLLSLIALRARRTPNLIKGLDICECQLGDYKACGLTEQKYRTAKKVLEALGLATFEPTSKGTIAKINNSTIYDINVCDANEQITDDQRTANEQVTTNKNVKKEKNVNKKDTPAPPEAKSTLADRERIIKYLNRKLGTSYKPNSIKTKSVIEARLNEGFSVEEFQPVIDNQILIWGNDIEMKKYLRPETLFGTKFESYLQATKIKAVPGVSETKALTMEEIEELNS